MKIDHVRLLVMNFAECFCFYRDVIGLSVKWGTENDSYASFSVQGESDPNLALFSRQAMAEVLGTNHLHSNPPHQDHLLLIIGVEDVDAAVARVQSLGAQVVLAPKNYPDWGMRSAYLRDPDGNLIELTCGLPVEDWSKGLQDAAKQYGQE